MPREMAQMVSDPGSFRDPAGHVFSSDSKIYRSVFSPGVHDFLALRDAGIYDKLIKAGLLFPHQETEIPESAPEGTVYCLNHPRIPMISYPWEWPLSMLKDAAIIHLQAMELLIPEGFWLRDASAFNVQYDGQRLRLIDTLSLGQRLPDSPWVAYGQFCSHFLAPIALAAYVDIRTLSLWRQYSDGYPLDLATSMLPFWRRYKPGLFMHLTLHARMQTQADRARDGGKLKPQKKPKVGDRSLIGLVRSLRRTIDKIRGKGKYGVWEKYTDIRSYSSDDIVEKSDYVERVVAELNPQMVWDLGANTGEFSLLAASKGALVVSIDGDPVCTEILYRKIFKEGGTGTILPLTMNLANPSPGLGWDNRERLSLRDRGPADLTLALALLHHLVFSSYVPLPLIAKWFSSISKHLLVEFVPPGDPMVKKMLLHRGGDHLPYSLELFKHSFGNFFDFVGEKVLPNGRKIYLCKRRRKS